MNALICQKIDVAQAEHTLETLCKDVTNRNSQKEPLLFCAKTADVLKKKLMDLAEYFMTCVLVDKDLPCLDISGHLLHGIIPKGETQFRGNPIFLNLRQARSDERWGRLMIICEEVFQLLLTNQHSTVRRIFYLYKDTFKNPSHVAHSIEDLARLLSCTRRDLNVRATAKGLVYGNLEWRTTDGDNWCSCHSAPTSIPSDMRAVVEMQSDATIVLIVEKDTVFQRLVDQNAITFLAQNGFKTIIVTGKGVPDFNTREMLWLLRYKIISNARFYVLTDADPYGIEIVGIYTFGSLRNTRLRLAINNLRWMGLLPSEIAKFKLDKSRRLPLSDMDDRRRIALTSRPWITARPHWRREVDQIRELGCKAEIEALNQFGQFFLLKEYILNKLLADTFSS